MSDHEPFEKWFDDALEEELLALGARATDDAYDGYKAALKKLELAPRNIHKLGGIPTFVQDAPDRRFAHQLFQIEESEPFDANFGDVGAGHLLVTSTGDLFFSWDSH